MIDRNQIGFQVWKRINQYYWGTWSLQKLRDLNSMWTISHIMVLITYETWLIRFLSPSRVSRRFLRSWIFLFLLFVFPFFLAPWLLQFFTFVGRHGINLWGRKFFIFLFTGNYKGFTRWGLCSLYTWGANHAITGMRVPVRFRRRRNEKLWSRSIRNFVIKHARLSIDQV